MRTFWKARTLDYGDLSQPLFVALAKYRQAEDRWPVPAAESNLVCSRTEAGRQMPILDLDFAHHYVPSSRPGHGHLFIDQEMSWFRWAVLLCALRFAGVIEKGFFAWSLRRGGNFVRVEGLAKSPEEQAAAQDYEGWVRRRDGSAAAR